MQIQEYNFHSGLEYVVEYRTTDVTPNYPDYGILTIPYKPLTSTNFKYSELFVRWIKCFNEYWDSSDMKEIINNQFIVAL